ncbi:MAG: hypothetical protein LBT09_10640 [Planctomycetaceae bacterium]|nr:hypothetical protein [Planctomycetaceae bacterium]
MFNVRTSLVNAWVIRGKIPLSMVKRRGKGYPLIFSKRVETLIGKTSRKYTAPDYEPEVVESFMGLNLEPETMLRFLSMRKIKIEGKRDLEIRDVEEDEGGNKETN